jgi:hypothetical protein
MPYKPLPTPPKTTSPIAMLNIGGTMASGWYESCMESTLPFDAAVVATAHSADWSVP